MGAGTLPRTLSALRSVALFSLESGARSAEGLAVWARGIKRVGRELLLLLLLLLLWRWLRGRMLEGVVHRGGVSRGIGDGVVRVRVVEGEVEERRARRS